MASARYPDIPLVVVMGVSGSGKSTIGAALARRLGVHFIDGDDLHPTANREKMSRGVPLDDRDRLPWLADVGRSLRDHGGTGLVIACSALRRRYRDVIRWEAPAAVFLHAHGDEDLLRTRMHARAGHFMPPALLASQLEALELLDESEPGFVVDIRAPLDDIVASAAASLQTEGSTWATALA